MTQANRKNNFIWLTAALVAMLLARGFTSEFPESFAFTILEYSSIVLMLVALRSLQGHRVWFTVLMILIGIMLLSSITRDVSGFQYFSFIYMFLLLAFFVSAAWLVGKEVLLTGKVDFNIITGSIALYLILGMIWSIFYTLLLQHSPAAFQGLQPEHWIDTLSTMTYFSFVTLTTLGYGDISPTTPMAEVLVILEAVTGMFYFAIVVASLISSARKN
jgi:voltage-gated potassium channel Kch